MKDFVNDFIHSLLYGRLSEQELLELRDELMEVKLTPEQKTRLTEPGYPEMLYWICDGIEWRRSHGKEV